MTPPLQAVETNTAPSTFNSTAEIVNICKKVREGKNLFITGKAGTGKSTLLSYLRANVLSPSHVVLGFTGVSALNVSGQTIHRFFNFKVDVTQEYVESDNYLPKNRNLMRALKTLIIDEVSMVRADLLDCVDAAMRRFGPKKGLPFGGVQVIFVGDLYQLAPIVRRSEMKFINVNYKTPFFFSSRGAQALDYETVELTHIFRQSDKAFIEILNAIRHDQMTAPMLHQLNNRVEPKFAPKANEVFLTLVTKKELANQINLSRLRSIGAPNHLSIAQVSGTVAVEEFPTEVNLNFKAGAQIMLVNNDGKERWVNGSLATIESVHINQDKYEDSYITARIADTGEVHDVNLHKWEVKRPRTKDDKLVYDTVGTFIQFPFILSWAITIHKSQGKTFDRVIIDLSEPTFASGQLYVALSRCRSLQGTVLRHPVLEEHIIVDDRINEMTHV